MTAPPRYPYVHVSVSRDDLECAGLALWELGASGVEERDGTTLNRPDAGHELTLIGSFADESSAQSAVEVLAERWPARIAFVEGDGWREAYKTYFKATRVGDRLIVRPPWESVHPSPGDVVLTLDPGAAFGTGTHETTRLVLRALETHVRPGMHVLDVGCGSGILAIAALLLGAQRASALDIDEEAVRATEDNAAANRVGARLEVERGELTPTGAAYPLVLANIESRVLVPLAATLLASVAPGGVLILSGLLVPEAERVRAAYAELELLESPRLGDWVALVLKRRGAGSRDG